MMNYLVSFKKADSAAGHSLGPALKFDESYRYNSMLKIPFGKGTCTLCIRVQASART